MRLLHSKKIAATRKLKRQLFSLTGFLSIRCMGHRRLTLSLDSHTPPKVSDNSQNKIISVYFMDISKAICVIRTDGSTFTRQKWWNVISSSLDYIALNFRKPPARF